MNSNKIARIVWTITSILYVAIILKLSLTPITLPIPTPFAHFDKFLHISIHFMLGLLWCESLISIKKFIVADFILGLSIELIQRHVPGRSFEFLDLLANCSGALFSILAIHFFFKPNLQEFLSHFSRDISPKNNSGGPT